jgi:hypothetical protein
MSMSYKAGLIEGEHRNVLQLFVHELLLTQSYSNAEYECSWTCTLSIF